MKLDPIMQEFADALHIAPGGREWRSISEEDRIHSQKVAQAHYELTGRPLHRPVEDIPQRRTDLTTGKIIQDTL